MKRFGFALAALLMTTAAQAADLNWNSGTSTMYSPSPAADWSGFYAGVNGGYGGGTTSVQPTAGGAVVDRNTGGWQLGAQAGYNMDMGGFVLGGEVDLQWANVGYSEALPGGNTFKATTDFYSTLRGRAGVTFGQVMPYVTGGLAIGRGTASLTDPLNVVVSQSNTHLGWTLGAGLEAKATENISFKAEYLYVDLGRQTYNGLPGGSIDATQRFGVVRAGLNYKF